MSFEKDWRWSRNAVRVDEALELIKGKSTVTVGHIDTGIVGGACLGDWVRQGKSFYEGPAEGIVQFDHGTKTCSVLTGYETDSESGAVRFEGVFPKLPVISYRAVDDVILDSEKEQQAVADAIDAAVTDGCAVVSISLGFPLVPKNGPLNKAVDRAYTKGVIICAAGGQIWGTPCYPGKFYRAIAVGGYVGRSGGRREMYWSYAGMNSFIDVWAPAERVFRAEALGQPGEKIDAKGVYDWGDGTSFATPHVAAAAAMWLTHHADKLPYAEPWQRVEAFRLLLKQTADNMSVFGGFEGIRPTEDIPPAKGNDPATSGGLDIPSLLQANLPSADQLVLAREAARQQF